MAKAPYFSRRGVTDNFGKLVDMGKLRVPLETSELIRQAAAKAGLPTMEYVRELLELGHHGRQEVDRRRTIVLDAIEVAIPKRDGKGRGR